MQKILLFLKQIRLCDLLLLATFLSTAHLALRLYDYAGEPYTNITMYGLFVGDIVFIAIFLATAFYTQKNIWSFLFVFSAIGTIGLRIGQYYLYTIGSLALRYDSLKLLWVHYDHRSAQVMVGEYYLPLSVAGTIIMIAVIIFVSKVIMREVRNFSKTQRDIRLVIASILILCGFVSHIDYYYERLIVVDGEASYTGHIVTPMPVLVRNILTDGFQNIAPPKREYGFIPQHFSDEEKEFLKKAGLIDTAPQGKALDVPFDRIFIVAVESLDGDFISANNPDLPAGLTAGIDSLKKKFVSFNNYFGAAAPTSWGLNTIYLSRANYSRDMHLDNIPLCSVLRNNHKIPSYYFSPILGTFGENQIIYKKLFDYNNGYFEKDLAKRYDFMEENNTWGYSDQTMYRAAIQFLTDEKPDKYFIILSTMDSHKPYASTGPAKDDEKYSSHGRFYQSLHCVDRNLMDFLEDFTSDPGLFNERTLLIITADHAASHGDNFTRRGGLGYPARIPLIMISKDNRAAKYFDAVKDKYCSSLDLPATILAMLGSTIPETFMGQDIRTKKSFALGKSTGDEFMIILPDDDNVRIDISRNPSKTNVERRALHKYYQQYYPVQK